VTVAEISGPECLSRPLTHGAVLAVSIPIILSNITTPLVGADPRRPKYPSANPRPWHGPFFPWGAAGWQPYSDLIKTDPELAPYWPKLKPLRYLKYMAQQRYKYVFERPAWMVPALHDYFVRSEAPPSPRHRTQAHG